MSARYRFVYANERTAVVTRGLTRKVRHYAGHRAERIVDATHAILFGRKEHPYVSVGLGHWGVQL